MRLSASSFAGTARTLVAVGTVSESSMFFAMAAEAPRSCFCSSPSAGFTGAAFAACCGAGLLALGGVALAAAGAGALAAGAACWGAGFVAVAA